jgi:hypothetical protein
VRRVLVALLLALGLVPSAQAQQSVAASRWNAMVGRSFPLRLDVVPIGGVQSGSGGGVSAGGTNVFTGSNTFTDSLFTIQDDGDNTKKLQVQLTGITTGNTIVGLTFSGTAAAPVVTTPRIILPEGAAATVAAGWGGVTGIYRISSANFAISQASQLRFAIGANKNLTESVATTVLTIAGGAGTYDAGSLDYTVAASDTTDFQARSGKVYWAYVNKAATETCVVTGFDGTANPTELKDSSGTGAMSAGTLTYAWAVDVTGANQCILTLNAVSSLTQTVLQMSVNQVNRGTQTSVTLTP